ncbi:MAG: ATP-binding cassette domain-containing protein, partial [Eubacteriales bacterium]
EVTALVGPSGGGKSTAMKLSARFWDVSEGTVTIGGVDISKIDPEELLKSISIVFQDVTLFNNSVLENIRIGNKDATDEEVIAVAKLANCDEFVQKMPDGYHSFIGENGHSLSGGERQRLSIARALLKDAPIILLDEATSSLDIKNESLVQDAIAKLIKNKTVLVIAHRMRTVAGADKIVLIKEGKVAEEGSYQALIQKDGLYKKMVELQTQSANWNIV